VPECGGTAIRPECCLPDCSAIRRTQQAFIAAVSWCGLLGRLVWLAQPGLLQALRGCAQLRWPNRAGGLAGPQRKFAGFCLGRQLHRPTCALEDLMVCIRRSRILSSRPASAVSTSTCACAFVRANNARISAANPGRDPSATIGKDCSTAGS
jgi:hypothetical protein